MTTLYWPGDERAGSLMSDSALLRALVEVETAWLGALVERGIADPAAAEPLADLVGDNDLPYLAARAEGSGNAVIPLLGMLRKRVRERNVAAATWLHRGLTSQDVLDTALMLCARDVLSHVGDEVDTQVKALLELATRYRGAPMVARTLTQHALPYTLGSKAASWLQGVLDAAEDLDRVAATLPSQLGGAAGTLAAAAELAALTGSADPVADALELTRCASARLGLAAHPPWHTTRAPVTRLGDALCGTAGAWGHIANDVLTLSRPEIGELAEPVGDGRGGSSAMPQKVNPVLSVLIRRAALAAPALAAQLHLAAADVVDERPAGAWHLEWQPLHLLGRHAVTAAAQTTELLIGLHVDTERMQMNLAAAEPRIRAEQQSLGELVLSPPDRSGDLYLGAAGTLVDAVCDRARARLKGRA